MSDEAEWDRDKRFSEGYDLPREDSGESEGVIKGKEKAQQNYLVEFS